jgi:hypothetical protein
MPARRASAVVSESTSPSEVKVRGRDGDKEKETFGCPFPGCGQVSSSSLHSVKMFTDGFADIQSYGISEKTPAET